MKFEEENKSTKTVTPYQIEQDLIKKVVPTFVTVLKETIAEKVLSAKTYKNYPDIEILPGCVDHIRNAFR